jgi:hypothetical protein
MENRHRPPKDIQVNDFSPITWFLWEKKDSFEQGTEKDTNFFLILRNNKVQVFVELFCVEMNIILKNELAEVCKGDRQPNRSGRRYPRQGQDRLLPKCH